jgi:DNA-binding GntR family transcriptional regulator
MSRGCSIRLSSLDDLANGEQWKKAVDEREQILALAKKRDGHQRTLLLRGHMRGKRPVIPAAYG